jgi:hypothetical protein
MHLNYRPSKKYKNVHQFLRNNQWKAKVKVGGRAVVTFHKTERDAALWIDKMLIKNGGDPVNILKKL